MSKKGYPGLVLVPPSDRTIVRRRIIRWSLVSIAIVWGLFTFLSSLAPSNKSDCRSVDTSISPSTTQEDCNPATVSVPQPRLEKTPPITEGPLDVSPTEEQSPLVSPESTKPVSEQTTDLLATANPPEARTTAEDQTVPAQPDSGPVANPSPNQSVRSSTATDHKTATQGGAGTAPQQLIPPAHATSDHKSTAQSGTGSAPTSGAHPPAKSVSSMAEHKVVTQTPKEPAAPSTPNQPTKMATPASADHKQPGQSGHGAAPTQTNMKPVAPSTPTTADRKPTTQLGHGAGQPQTPGPPAKPVNAPPDHKQMTQSHTGSVPHQTSPQGSNATQPSPERKVVTQLGSGSASPTHPTGNANSLAEQSSSGASLDQSLPSNAQQDTRLAEGGDAFAQYRLGRLYAQQGGRHAQDAVKWYRRASTGLRRLAEAGNGQAMYILGVMYAYGRGVSQNTNEARLWLSQAVERKVSAARPVLASLEKDRSIAHSTR